jgi:hypothetical protein
MSDNSARRRPRHAVRVLVTVVATVGLSINAPAASASVTETWGWTTDTFTMSFFGGIPYVGCEKATLTVPNSGSTGDLDSTTWSSIVVGVGGVCSNSSIPSSLNNNTIKTQSKIFRNGSLQSGGGCSTSVTYNTTGQGSISVSTSGCQKSSTTDATWSVSGYYGWWDYDDTVWRSETVVAPIIED